MDYKSRKSFRFLPTQKTLEHLRTSRYAEIQLLSRAGQGSNFAIKLKNATLPKEKQRDATKHILTKCFISFTFLIFLLTFLRIFHIY